MEVEDINFKIMSSDGKIHEISNKIRKISPYFNDLDYKF